MAPDLTSYGRLSQIETECDTLSSEENGTPDHRHSPNPKRRTFGGFSFMSLSVLGLVIVVSNITATLIMSLVWGELSSPRCSPPKTDSKLAALLYAPSETRNYTADPLLGQPATIESNKAWEGLLGPSKGFIAIEHPEKYHLPRSFPHPTDPAKSVYGVFMFHQIHCLALIRERYYDFLTGRITPDDFKFVQGTSGENGSNELPHLGDLHKGAAHIDHCFDYLQQGIRCAGQMDLEYPVGTEEAGFLAGEYQCRSWDGVMKVMNDLSFEMPPDDVSTGDGHGH